MHLWLKWFPAKPNMVFSKLERMFTTIKHSDWKGFFPVGFFQHLCRKKKLVSLSVFRVIDFHGDDMCGVCFPFAIRRRCGCGELSFSFPLHLPFWFWREQIISVIWISSRYPRFECSDNQVDTQKQETTSSRAFNFPAFGAHAPLSYRIVS